MRAPYIGTALSRIPISDRQDMVPTEPIARHIQKLLDVGMSKSGIARSAGVSTAMVSLMLSGKHKTTRRVVADAFLAADGRADKQQALVLNVGCRRRIEGLAVLGFSFPMIARELGIDHRSLWMIHGRRWVSWETHERVRCAFDRMGIDGGNTKIRNVAARNGWVHPLLWDDIDDPFEVTPSDGGGGSDVADPVAVERLIAGVPVSAAAVDKREAFELLIGRGWTMSAAAAHVGINHQTAVRYSNLAKGVAA